MTGRALLTAATVGAVVAVIVLVIVMSSGGDSSDPLPPVDLPAAAVRDGIDVGSDPVAVAVGAGGVWVLDAAEGTLSRVDPDTRRVAGRPARVDGGPFAVAVGEGAVWVASTDGTVRAFDPRTMEPTGRAAQVRGANGLAVGLGGVWVTSRLAGTLTRIDPATRRVDPPIRVGAGPADVAVGAGAVWVANADAGSVSRVDPGSGRADAPIAVGTQQVRALAVGEDGVWVARAGGRVGDRLEVVRIDPRERELDGEPVPVPGAVPLDMAAAGGSVWITDAGGLPGSRPGGVSRLDPRARRLAGTLLTGDRPSAVAVGENGAWVTNAGDGTLTPISVGGR
jgi:DNA-binding beta-propeller fold protein YncE